MEVFQFNILIYILLQTAILTESKSNAPALIDKIMEKKYTDCDKMFFPIHLDGHFSLLEFIKENRVWIHYDSMRPRTEGPHAKLARKVVCNLKK